jgi:hypothetical protein
MTVKEGSATALVRFTGLGIICFNKDKQRGEIGIIRDGKHKLTITIQRPVFQEGSGKDILGYENVATYEGLSKEDVQIEIKALGKPAIEGYEIYQPGNFDRLDSPDANDFRWLVNMNSLHGDTSLVTGTQDRHPLTKIYIDNGFFYTHKLDTDIVFEKVAQGSNGNTTQRELFGNVAETLGVKIEGDEVKFTIRFDGKEETHRLKRIDGLPFKIEIKNMDSSANAVYSDMPDYYKYLSPAGARFDLTPIVEESGGSVANSVNSREYCHPTISRRTNGPPRLRKTPDLVPHKYRRRDHVLLLLRRSHLDHGYDSSLLAHMVFGPELPARVGVKTTSAGLQLQTAQTRRPNQTGAEFALLAAGFLREHPRHRNWQGPRRRRVLHSIFCRRCKC